MGRILKTMTLLYIVICGFVFNTALVYPQQNESSEGMTIFPSIWPVKNTTAVRYGDNRTLGYNDLILPVYGDEKNIIFLNQKTNGDDNSSTELNFGLGMRHLVDDESLILGANVFYDTRKTSYNNRHQQVGVGVELLSDKFDIRSNFYYPTTNKKSIGQATTYRFASRSLLADTLTHYEEPLKGCDYEAGLPIPYLSDFIPTKAFFGGYNYVSKQSKNINGIRSRLEVKLNKFFTFDFEITDDNVSDLKTHVGFRITIPFGGTNTDKGLFAPLKGAFTLDNAAVKLKTRMTDMVIRDIDVITATSGSTTTATEKAGVVFVDNSNTSVEDGSYDNPYNTIQEGINNATTGDKTVYVREGNATYTENLTMASNVTLWGSGSSFDYAGITAGTHPVVDGSTATVITLADKGTVAGLQIQNGANGIYGLDTEVALIQDNIITANTSNGVYINTNNAATSDLDILNNTISANGVEGTITVGVRFYTKNANIADINVTGNTVASTQKQYGVYLKSIDTSDVTININNNNLSNNHLGVSLWAKNNSTVNFNINSNVASNEKRKGIQLAFFNDTIGNGTTKGNVFDSNLASAIAGFTFDDAALTVTCQDNVISNMGGMGIAFFIDSSKVTNIVCDNNTIRGSAGDGLHFDANPNTGGITASITNNNVSDIAAEGVQIDAGNSSTVTINSFQNNTIVGSRRGVNFGWSATDNGTYIINNFINNSIYDNVLYDANNMKCLTDINLENNWWGTSSPLASQFNSEEGFGAIDYTPWLTADPN